MMVHGDLINVGGIWYYGPLVILVMAAGGVKRVGLTGEYKNLEGAAIVANKSSAFKHEF